MIFFDKVDRQKIGNLIKEGRIAKGLSQYELSLQLGFTSAQTISNMERGIALPPRVTLSDLICLGILSEKKFKKICLDIVKKDLNKICSA